MSAWFMMTMAEAGLFIGVAYAPWYWMKIMFSFFAGGWFTLGLLKMLGTIS